MRLTPVDATSSDSSYPALMSDPQSYPYEMRLAVRYGPLELIDVKVLANALRLQVV